MERAGDRVTRNKLVWAGLFLLLALVIAFVTSFVLGLRDDTTAPAAKSKRDLPGVFSGRRVEVLNAAGRAGLARQATDLLRDAGFDVVYFGNTKPDSVSVVIDRVGARDVADGVARALGIDSVMTVLDSTRLVESTVWLGSNWRAPAR